MRALITGAASGLGAALTTALRARGDEVLATDRTTGEGVDLALDITSDADWSAALDHVRSTWGGLDLLVNNAGIAGGGRLEVCTLEEWQHITEVNLFGMVRGVRAFTPLLKEQGSGAILNVASLAGLVHPAGMASYNATKAAVVAFTETIGHELAAYGISAHVLCPSYFRTNLVSSLEGSDAVVGHVIGSLVDNSPISADAIAEAALRGLDEGREVIVPDEAARAAWSLKKSDRPAYDAIMRDQAAKLHQAATLHQSVAATTTSPAGGAP